MFILFINFKIKFLCEWSYHNTGICGYSKATTGKMKKGGEFSVFVDYDDNNKKQTFRVGGFRELDENTFENE